MRYYRIRIKKKRSLRRPHSLSTNKVEELEMGTPQHTHFVLPLVRGFPRQCHGPCCLTIPHAWTPLFQCIFTSYFCLGLDNHLSLSPKEQTWIQATGLSRFCVMVTMLYAESLLFSHGWGLVTESGSFAQSFFLGLFSSKDSSVSYK